MTVNIFPTILLIARPGAGKSEIINYLKNSSDADRRDRFHIGSIAEIDDFPFLWRWFEEDDLLSQMGKERLFTDSDGYFKVNYLWDLLIKMINLDYKKFLRDSKEINEKTVLIEFSRGKEHGGYKQALPLLSKDILKNLSIIYVNVPWEESLRKNRHRFNPDKPDSILEHGLPDVKLKRLYRECDFLELSASSDEALKINGIEIPYVIFENGDDVTTAMGPELGKRLDLTLGRLWEIRTKLSG